MLFLNFESHMVCLMVSISLQQIGQPNQQNDWRNGGKFLEWYTSGQTSIYTIIKTTSEFRNVSVTWRKWAWLAGCGRHTLMHVKQK